MNNDERILISRPEYDDITIYMHKWSEDLITHAEKQGLEITDLNRDEANKDEIEGYLDSLDHNILVLNGHGNSEIVAGHDDEPLLIQGENENLTSGSLMYVRSCKSGKSLGKNCVEKGDAEAFIGYKDNFVLPINTNSVANPKEDKLAEPVMKASNEAAKALIEGKDGETAYKRSQEKYKAMRDKVLANYTLGNQQVLAALATNRQHQVIHAEDN